RSRPATASASTPPPRTTAGWFYWTARTTTPSSPATPAASFYERRLRGLTSGCGATFVCDFSPSPGTPGEGWVGAPCLAVSSKNPHPCPPPEYREREEAEGPDHRSQLHPVAGVGGAARGRSAPHHVTYAVRGRTPRHDAKFDSTGAAALRGPDPRGHPESGP